MVDSTPPTLRFPGSLPAPEEDCTGPISDRYRLVTLVGSGGFGQVFQAQDEKLDREVALKVVRRLSATECLSLSDEQASRFLREAQTLARLDHPHIVPVYDAGVEAGTPWIVMRLVKGKTLDALLADLGPWTPEKALELLVQLAEALRHAHQHGIIHRDLKPANILIEKDSGPAHAWLTDFGIAALRDDGVGERSRMIGTPGYMAPEQIEGQPADERTDIFSLGCIGVELITGRRAFAGRTVQEVLAALREGRADLGGIKERTGWRYEELLRRCLARSPADRWQTMEDLLQNLPGALSPRRVWSLRPPFRRQARPAPAWDGRFPLKVERLSTRYGWRTRVLDQLDLAVPRGSIFALLGRNGSGKTTLLRTCLGLNRRDRGKVEIFGKDPQLEGRAVLARTGWVPDELYADKGMRVRELLDFVASAYPRWDKPHCYRLLARFDLPLEQRIRHLSRGMRTKVSLLLALSHRPELILLDDPTLGLDGVVMEELMEALKEAHRMDGVTIVLASHEYEEIERIVTHVGLLRHGSLLLTSPLEDLKHRTREVRATFPGRPPDLSEVAGLTGVQVSGHEVTAMALDADAAVLDRLRSLADVEVEFREPSLREIFVRLLRQG